MNPARNVPLVLALLLLAVPLRAQQRPDTTAADTSRPRRQQPRERQSTDQNEQAVPRVDNIPLDPAMRGFVALPGTDWTLRVGGYAKTDAMFDSRPAGSPDLFVTSSIPTGDPPAGEGQSFNMHVRQTRLSLELRRPSSLGGMLRAYFEGDLYGPDGTTAPHLRHAYLQASNLLVGQTFSAFIDVDALPDGVDFEGPGSTTFLLSPQVRYTRPFGERWSVAVSAEQPVAQLTVPEGATPVERFPDVVVRPRYEAAWGHVQVATIVRGLSYNDGQDGRNRTTGYGVQPTALIGVGPRDNLFVGGVWGHGVARYVNDLGGLGLDGAVEADGGLTAIPVYGWYVSLQHLLSPRWRGVVTGGWLQVDPPATMPGTTTERTVYYGASAIWSPRPTVDIGTTALYGQHRTRDGSEGHAWRFQTALQLYLAK
jgi:hypothetical protein